MSALTRIGNYISTERGFRTASMLGFGVPTAVIGVWTFKGYGEAAWLLVVPGAAVAAYIWGAIMWKLVFRDIYAQRHKEVAPQVSNQNPRSSDTN